MVKIMAVRGPGAIEVDLSPDALPDLLADDDARVWVDLSGPTEEVSLHILRDVFGFHSLTIKDCFEARENPKVEIFDDYIYSITHGLTPGSNEEESEIVELDAFLGGRFLVTYHERHSRSVEGAIELVARNGGAALRRGPAYVLSLVLERQVDGIEPVLEHLEAGIEELEERVSLRPVGHDLGRLLALKRTTLQLRRWMSKQRDVVTRLGREDLSLIPHQDALQFRHVQHHLQQFTDALENFREMLIALQGTYLNVTNLRLSEIMKFLTVFTAILMPLTVITGVYGMNFEHMPELHSVWGYPMVLGLMTVTGLTILIIFKKRGWLERTRPRPEDAADGIRKSSP